MKFTTLSTVAVLVLGTFVSAAPTGQTKAQNYIIQLDKSAVIDDFVPKFVRDTEKHFEDLFKEVGEKVEGLFDNKDENGSDQFRVQKSFDIGGKFKALNVALSDNRILDKILKGFSEVVSVIPDEKIKFDLPTPAKKSKRYYIRPVEGDKSSYNGPHPRDVAAEAEEYTEQDGAQWNLVRVSQHDLAFSDPYIYDSRAGSGVTAYVIDDGVAIDHEDFEGRATRGYSAYEDDKSQSPDGGGHGTHVSGIIGGKTYGVAKNVSIVSVQVLDNSGSGTISAVLGGIEYVTKQEKGKNNPVVINMSLGMPDSGEGGKSLNDAISAAVEAGLPFFVAAGNSASDACHVVPAQNPDVFTVGSIDNKDTFDDFSCYGKCVDISAPGNNIKSTYIGGKDATEVMSGTSMASPHACGVGALLLSTMPEGTAPKDLYSEMSKIATSGKIEAIPDSATPNKILFNGQTKTEQ